MNKNDLVSAVADAAGLTKADAGRAVDGVFDSIAGALKGGGCSDCWLWHFFCGPSCNNNRTQSKDRRDNSN